MDNKTLAKIILKDLGGEDNIISFIDTGDRLRFNLRDNLKIDNEHLRQTKRVLATFVSCGQFHVVLNHDANRLYKHLKNLTSGEKRSFFKREKTINDEMTIYSPIKGRIVEIKNAVGVMPETNLLVSPINGRIEKLTIEKSAVTIISNEGVEVIVHIGENTNSLRSRHTKNLIDKGDKVRLGDPIFEFEPTAMRIEGCEPVTIVEISDTKSFSKIKNETGAALEKQPLIYLKR